MKNNKTQYRIVKEETLNFRGGLNIRYYPEYKGWFGWHRFTEYDGDGFSRDAVFEQWADAQAFINNHARLNGFQKLSVVGEFYGTKE